MITEYNKIKTLADLKESNYQSKSVKTEMRDNLIKSIREDVNLFDNILGYENTVIPELQSAILAKHNMILLGLRGQAKTKIARLMVNLLDEYIPIIEGSEIFDDPFNPISKYGKDKVSELRNETPIEWIHRNERYSEKLATPDVTIADLIGDVDPIKAASLKLNYSDERVIHFGIIPRTHRGIFVINELPDLQARIQVALFNLLQEKDVQIRGFKLRLPLDVQFIFTANPEDYTNRGSIVTPLKDRIESQILTHYPKSKNVSREITAQEAKLTDEQKEKVEVSDLIVDLVETVAFEARNNEYVDERSGVSARLTISAFENLISTAERRCLINDEDKTSVRISDFHGIIPSITGKVELVYEGEQEGAYKVANILINRAIKKTFDEKFVSPDEIKKSQMKNPYQNIINWFNSGNKVDLLRNSNRSEYMEKLQLVPDLEKLVKEFIGKVNDDEKYLFMEFLLFGLAEYSMLSKHNLDTKIEFSDMLGSMFSQDDDDYLDDIDDDFNVSNNF